MFKKKNQSVESAPANTEGENAIANKEIEGLSQGQIVRRRFVRHRAAMIALFSLLGITLFVFTASGVHLGSEKTPITISGWWHYSITDLPELAMDGCPDGTVGCPTLDILPPFISSQPWPKTCCGTGRPAAISIAGQYTA